MSADFGTGRGVRVVYGGGLENRCPEIRDRGFESHPLRFFDQGIVNRTGRASPVGGSFIVFGLQGGWGLTYY